MSETVYDRSVFVIWGNRVDGGERECLGWYEHYNPANNQVNSIKTFGRYTGVHIENMTLKELGQELGQYGQEVIGQ